MFRGSAASVCSPAPRAGARTYLPQVMQDLAYSATDANSDLDDYFNSLQKSNVRANNVHHHDNDVMIDDDGLPTLTREKSKKQAEEAAVNKEELENYKKHNPEFKKQMDEVLILRGACVLASLPPSLPSSLLSSHPPPPFPPSTFLPHP